MPGAGVMAGVVSGWSRRASEPSQDEEGHEELDYLDVAVAQAPWHVSLAPDKQAWLEGFVVRTLKGISDPFVRDVAWDQWLAEEPSPISGAANGKKPLTERWGKSRFQVHRALRWARAFLFAALEAQDEMEIELEAFHAHRNPSRSPAWRPP